MSRFGNSCIIYLIFSLLNMTSLICYVLGTHKYDISNSTWRACYFSYHLASLGMFVLFSLSLLYVFSSVCSVFLCFLIDEISGYLSAQSEETQCRILCRHRQKHLKLSRYETRPVLPQRRRGGRQSRGGAGRRSGGHWSESLRPLHTFHYETVPRNGAKGNGLC